MKRKQNEERISGLMALLLFAVFAICIMLVLLTGAKVYQRLVQRDQKNFDSRTAVSYLTAKIHQSDCISSLGDGEFAGTDMLVITETIDGIVYETRIYCYDGYICELFTIEGSESSPEDGIRVLPAKSLKAAVEKGNVCVEITDMNDQVLVMKQSLRSGKEY